ncbi:MAG: hypothetical protein IID41_12900 [Planctomycetes bacterium]|nr:hypothetical protein [Planctomycetota bacterium]
MSVIVAVTKKLRSVVATDSLSCFGNHGDTSGNIEPKSMRRVGSALIGCTGWALYDTILEDYLSRGELPVLDDRMSIFKFFVGFWKVLREDYSFVEDQCNKDDDPFVDLDSSFLVLNRNGIFGISRNMDVSHYKKYHAIGCACDYAYGALYSLYDGEADPQEIAEGAVRAAISFDIHCAGDIQVFEVD